jgi:membrane protein implicated in regulation of membrane protease activity
MQWDQQAPQIGYRSSLSARAGNLLFRIVAFTLGAALVAAALVVSVVFFAVALGVAVVVGGYLFWRTRHVRKQMRQHFAGRDIIAERDIIEGTVLKSE